MSQVVTGSAQPSIVTITGEVSAAVAVKSLSVLAGTNTSAASPTTLGTVPASKVWRIYAWSFERHGTADATAQAYLKANTTNLCTMRGGSAAGATGIASMCLPVGCYFQIAAGHTVTILAGTSGGACANVFYEEIAA